MNKVWVVCQESEGQKPCRVMAFAEKDLAADDCARRLKASPDSVYFWLESVDMAVTQA